jgi:redox-sensitive bicupin YhaK (pirin superfamily)
VIELVIEQRRRSLGGGLEVGRVLPFAKRHMVGPFIFFDHMGPVNFPQGIPSNVDVRPHPHIGLSTLTYLFDGEIMHRDSVGSEQAIRPGEVNWMVAGSGITHSERFERARREGGPLNGIQAWIALPQEHEEAAPAFFHHGMHELPVIAEHRATGRLIAGETRGVKGVIQTHSPLFYVHWVLELGAELSLPADYTERALYIASGSIEMNGNRFDAGQMIVLKQDAVPSIRAQEHAVVMALGGEPVGPRFIDWNFVSSSRERIEQARADWQGGRMKLPDLDNREWIPLPADLPPLSKASI